MKNEKLSQLIILLFGLFMYNACIAQENSDHNLKSKVIEYKADNITMKGYMVYDQNIKGKRPAVIVVHEWWGLNDYARNRADMLAKLGYTAFAVDMYGDGKTADHPKDAQKFAMESTKDLDGASNRLQKALEIVRSHETVDKNNIAAIGYCFGGGLLLNLARNGLDINGVVSFHGSLAARDTTNRSPINTKILVCHGGADNFVPYKNITDFIEEMERKNTDYTLIVYSGAKHSFTNPGADKAGEEFGIAIAYNKIADEQSWIDMQQFFERIFDK